MRELLADNYRLHQQCLSEGSRTPPLPPDNIATCFQKLADTLTTSNNARINSINRGARTNGDPPITDCLVSPARARSAVDLYAEILTALGLAPHICNPQPRPALTPPLVADGRACKHPTRHG